ncbi:MAG: nickel pincer cofactor biosynthesis protein LarC [Lachnospiraceae bacterium]|nr:nickel pincer cofactor biosynthesis protein LarC [Lachnospiraceae bacterium]
MKKLYFDCMSGISGDMTVAALLDLGADRDVLTKALDSIMIEKFDIEIRDVYKNGLRALKFDVMATESHVHRHLADIHEIIANAAMTDEAKVLAYKMFGIVAEAESIAHGIDINKVHFHEVGAVDSIVDIISTAVCIDNLGVKDVMFSGITEGKGYVKCAHGRLAVPVPAVLNIVSLHNLTLRQSDAEGEMITPTGAAIAAALRTEDKLPKEYKVIKIGIGAGTKDFEHPNVLRVMLIEDAGSEADSICELSTNIDDATGETLGYTMEKLFEAGAYDVFFQPIYMKKNRPAYMLNVICDESCVKEMEKIIFLNTTTLGIRRYDCKRTVLKREKAEVFTSFGQICCKKVWLGDTYRIFPEYESVRAAAEEKGLGYDETYRYICKEIEEYIKNEEKTDK